jgi:hypothetical protein
MITSPIGEVCRVNLRQGEVKTKLPKPSAVPHGELSNYNIYGFLPNSSGVLKLLKNIIAKQTW